MTNDRGLACNSSRWRVAAVSQNPWKAVKRIYKDQAHIDSKIATHHLGHQDSLSKGLYERPEGSSFVFKLTALKSLNEESNDDVIWVWDAMNFESLCKIPSSMNHRLGHETLTIVTLAVG